MAAKVIIRIQNTEQVAVVNRFRSSTLTLQYRVDKWIDQIKA